MYRIVTAVMLSFLLSACNTWQRIDESSSVIETDQYRVTMPMGWVQLKVNNHLLVTRDGPDLQKIEITVSESSKAFAAIEKGSSEELLPSELAELYIADLRKQHKNGLPSLEVLSNAPATVDGHDGFQLMLRYRADNGLFYNQRVTGFAAKDAFYCIFYRAPALHYYALDDTQYDEVLHGFKMKI
jgi:hypothetical protein